MDFGFFSEDFFETISNIHELGVSFGKTIVLYGVGFSLSKNIIRVVRSRIRTSVAIADFIRDVIVIFIIGYVIGGVGIGEILSTALDSTTTEILRSMGVGDFVGDSTNIFLGLLYYFGVDFGSLPTFALTIPALLIGAIIGAIFGILFD